MSDEIAELETKVARLSRRMPVAKMQAMALSARDGSLSSVTFKWISLIDCAALVFAPDTARLDFNNSYLLISRFENRRAEGNLFS